MLKRLHGQTDQDEEKDDRDEAWHRILWNAGTGNKHEYVRPAIIGSLD
jgi:hypothetical protein